MQAPSQPTLLLKGSIHTVLIQYNNNYYYYYYLLLLLSFH